MGRFLFSFNPSAIVVWILILLYLVYYFLGKYYFFKKIGEDGWKGLIPIYSEAIYFKRAKQKVIFPVSFLVTFLVFFVLSLVFSKAREFVGVCTFIETASLIFYILLSWKANYLYSKKFKTGYFTVFSLTFVPFISIPFIGLSDDYKWHRFVKIDKTVFDEEFYSRKITVGERCITNVFMIFCVMIEFYIFTYIFLMDMPKSFIFELIWEPEFVLYFSLVFAGVAIGGTLLDYYGNKLLKKRNNK